MNEECDARGTGLVEIEADIYYRAVMNVLIYQHGEGNKWNDMLWFKNILCLRVQCCGGELGGELENDDHHRGKFYFWTKLSRTELDHSSSDLLAVRILARRASERWAGRDILLWWDSQAASILSCSGAVRGRDLDSISITQAASLLSRINTMVKHNSHQPHHTSHHPPQTQNKNITCS